MSSGQTTRTRKIINCEKQLSKSNQIIGRKYSRATSAEPNYQIEHEKKYYYRSARTCRHQYPSKINYQ